MLQRAPGHAPEAADPGKQPKGALGKDCITLLKAIISLCESVSWRGKLEVMEKPITNSFSYLLNLRHIWNIFMDLLFCYFEKPSVFPSHMIQLSHWYKDWNSKRIQTAGGKTCSSLYTGMLTKLRSMKKSDSIAPSGVELTGIITSLYLSLRNVVLDE